MKRLLAFLLSFAMILTLCACTNGEAESTTTLGNTEPTYTEEQAKAYRVPNPLTYPDYTFDGTPTTDELRQTAVQAMRDLLSVQWCTATEIAYYKTGAASKKRFCHKPVNTYGGTLYSNASTGLFQFLEYYNYESGMLEYPNKMSMLQHELGSACADCVLWGWSSVCNSISAGFHPVFMVQRNGYLPVGGYVYNENIISYHECPSYTIIEENGKDTIFKAYTQVQPADVMVSTSDDHAMMVIEPPVVVYNDDGTINTEKSYIVIQDQWAGTPTGFFDVEENGITIHYTGRTHMEFTFDWFLSKNYIPVTAAEFIGEKEYESATVATSQSCTTPEQVQKTAISSNYPLAVVRVVLEDENGQRNILERKFFNGKEASGVPRNYQLSGLRCWKTFDSSELNKTGNTLKIEVVSATGEVFTPIELTL